MAEPVEDPTKRIKQLSEKAGMIVIDVNIPPRRYFRSGMEILRMATIYLEEGNLEKAFILYTKYIILFLEKLPEHKDYKSISSADKKSIKKRLSDALGKAEQIKEGLRLRYSKEYEAWQLHQQFLHEQEAEREREREALERMLENKKKTSPQPAPRGTTTNHHFNDVTGLAPQLPTWPEPDYDDDDVRPVPSAPSLPSRQLKPENLIPIVPELPQVSQPQIDRTSKPSPSSLLSAGGGLKPVVIPASLMVRFMALAESNTARNVETCGILCGTLARDSFTITHLVVPKQRGTSDSCSTENEEEIFDYQDQFNLVTLGWIHTHPSQTSFMSSVDLHTHCAYQLMMPEAIAIVCAPKFNETGVFSLTPDYGLDYIAKCREPGFHPHPKHPTLYQESSHARIDQGSAITVADLR